MPGQGQTKAFPTSRDKKLSFEQKLKTAAIIIAILSFAGCSALTVREYIALDQGAGGKGTRGRAEPAKELNRRLVERAAAPVNLLRLLPATIEGFNTQAYHQVPSQEKFAAEAIYETTKEEIFAPHNSYVKITFYENPKDAAKVISKNLKIRYPVDTAILTRKGIRVHTGYEKGYGGYYLAYVTDRYLIEIHTNFLAVVPQDRGTLLEDSAWGVFDGVSRQVTAALGR